MMAQRNWLNRLRNAVGTWVLENSLWLVSLGLMLASSGIDGAYMTKWMPGRWGPLGLVLNTMSDIGSMVLAYWYGRLQQDRSIVKQRRSKVLLIADIVMVAYSWFFSWRQLRVILPQVEPQHWQWVSAISAGFIPLLLIAIGYAQSLLAGRLEPASKDQKVDQIVQKAVRRPAATIADWRQIIPQLNGNRGSLTANQVKAIVIDAGFDPPSERTLHTWANVANDE